MGGSLIENRSEIFNLPFYFTEDGKKRYVEIGIDERDQRIYDEYGRFLSEEYFGDKCFYTYDDKKHIVHVRDYDAVYDIWRSWTREFLENEYVD